MKNLLINNLLSFLQDNDHEVLVFDPYQTIKTGKSNFFCSDLQSLKYNLSIKLWDLIIFDADTISLEIIATYKRKHPQVKLIHLGRDAGFATVLRSYQLNIDLFLPRENIAIEYLETVITLVLSGYDRVIISKNPELQKCYIFAKFYARNIKTDFLITGENGTGKGIIARAIYHLGNFKGDFVVQNCAGIPDTLFESELFGYEAGSFTGALSKGKKGIIEKAENGVLFLDEIGELPINQQAKLLRVVQRKVILPIGSVKERKIKARFAFATNKNLYEELINKNFREDFYYRIKGAEIVIPPLRDTIEDLEMMIAVFTNRFIKEHMLGNKITAIKLDQESLKKLQEYNFPGNMRELQKIVYQGMINLLINETDILKPETINSNISAIESYKPKVESLWQIINLLEAKLIKYKGISNELKRDVLNHLRTKYNDDRKMIAAILGFSDKNSLANEIYKQNRDKNR